MTQLTKKDMDSPSSINADTTLEYMLAGERTRLIHLCARLTGNREAAEDLAQETLLEAWRKLHTFHDGDDRESMAKWLAAIARNVCKRWARSRGNDRAHLMPLYTSTTGGDELESSIDVVPADGFDIEIELERDELAQLLDRVLSYLPPTTRDVLIERYIHESPHAEIAERLGLSEDALVQRLHRGKLALRRAITTHMSEEARAYGFSAPVEENTQQETRIWCPLCAARHLIKYVDPSYQIICFRCPDCGQISGHGKPELFADIHSPKSVLNRQLYWLGDHYWRAINMQEIPCPFCNGTVHSRVYHSQNIPAGLLQQGFFSHCGIYLFCSSCPYEEINGLSHLILDTPETRQFWRKHPRMQWMPPREIEYGGQPAILSSYQSPGEQARIDVISQRDTLKILDVFEHAR